MPITLNSLTSYAKRAFPALFGTIGTPGTLTIGDTDWTPSPAAIAALNDMIALPNGNILMGVSGTSALTNPTTGPTLTGGTGGSLALLGVYEVSYTLTNTFGETLPTSATTVTLTGSQNRIVVTAITPLPTGATGVNWYVSDASLSITLRLHSSNAGATFNINTLPPNTNDLPPSSNTTASADHAEKGIPTGSSGIVVTTSAGGLDFAYSPAAHNDQNGYYLRRLRIENFTTTGEPAGLGTSDKGRLYWNTTISKLKGFDGSNWQIIGSDPVPATALVLGIVEITGTPVDVTHPIAVGDTDTRMTNSRAPSGTAGGSLGGTYPNPTIADAGASTKGLTKLSTAPVSGTNPIAVGDNDSRMTDSRTPSGSAGGALTGTYPNPTLPATGVTAGSYTNGNFTVSANGLLSAASNGSGSTATVPHGTGSFPGSPTTNDQFIRDDLNTLSRYNGSGWSTIGGGGGSFIGARVFRSTTQSTTHAVDTPISFDTEIFDTDTIHDNSTNPTRLTATTTGYYSIGGSFAFDANSAGFRSGQILVNGTTTLAYMSQNANTSNVSGMMVSTLYHLTATDYVELVATQNSGGSLNVYQGSAWTPIFWMVKVG